MSYKIEKTIRSNGEKSIVLVNEDYKIVEEVVLFLNYIEKKGNALNTIDSYCRDLKEFYNWLDKEGLKFYEVSKRTMISWIDYVHNAVGNKKQKCREHTRSR